MFLYSWDPQLFCPSRLKKKWATSSRKSVAHRFLSEPPTRGSGRLASRMATPQISRPMLLLVFGGLLWLPAMHPKGKGPPVPTCGFGSSVFDEVPTKPKVAGYQQTLWVLKSPTNVNSSRCVRPIALELPPRYTWQTKGSVPHCENALLLVPSCPNSSNMWFCRGVLFTFLSSESGHQL